MPADLQTPDGAKPDVADFTLAHLSDTHLRPAGELYNAVIDADEALASVVGELLRAQRTGVDLDAVVVSGDLTDTGDPGAYARLRAALQPLDVPLIYATGNHDVREVFHRELLGVDWEEQRVQQVWLAERLRVVVLDSTVVGAGNGRLEPSTLSTLTELLRQPAPAGTVLVLHHAPVPPPSPLLTYFALERSSRNELAEVITDTDVRLILAGHHHLAQSGALAGVPVAVAGSTAIRVDPLAPRGRERTTRSRSFNLVRLYSDTAVVSVVPIDGAEQVFDLDDAACAAVIEGNPAR